MALLSEREVSAPYLLYNSEVLGTVRWCRELREEEENGTNWWKGREEREKDRRERKEEKKKGSKR